MLRRFICMQPFQKPHFNDHCLLISCSQGLSHSFESSPSLYVQCTYFPFKVKIGLTVNSLRSCILHPRRYFHCQILASPKVSQSICPRCDSTTHICENPPNCQGTHFAFSFQRLSYILERQLREHFTEIGSP